MPSDIPASVLARVGRVLKDKWRIEAVIGTGGMAAVYRARHRNGKLVAIKVLHAELSLHPEIRARFLREGYVANTVAHKGAVSVDDDDVADDGSAFLVMELLEGETLEQRAKKHGGRLPVAEALGLADQLLDALAAAHDKGVVHRDLKPDNLFLTDDGTLKILDFGIARVRELSASASGGQSAGAATHTGTFLGTPAFMAPEQARGRWDLVGPHTDLWAVGATLFTLLTGQWVHTADTVQELLATAMSTPARSIAALRPDLPAPVVGVIDRALALDRDKRWPDARAMQAAVRAARAQLGDAVESAPARGEALESAPTLAASASTAVVAPPTQEAEAPARRPSALTVGGLSREGNATGRGPGRLLPMAAGALLLIGLTAGAFALRGRGAGDPHVAATADDAHSAAPATSASATIPAVIAPPSAEPQVVPAASATEAPSAQSAAPAASSAPRVAPRVPTNKPATAPGNVFDQRY